MLQVLVVTQNEAHCMRKMMMLKGTCGGFIELDGNETQISHTLPAIFPTGYQASCVWVVWAPKGGPIKLQSSLNYPSSSGINLVVAYNDGNTAVTKSLNV